RPGLRRDRLARIRRLRKGLTRPNADACGRQRPAAPQSVPNRQGRRQLVRSERCEPLSACRTRQPPVGEPQNTHQGGFMPRMMIDCREMPSESGCTLALYGEEAELLRAAVAHAVDVHGHTDDAELRAGIRSALRPATT